MKTCYVSSDTELTLLANQLELLAFELSDADVLKFQELSETQTLQNVAAYVGGRTFRVRLCVGGKQHVIGITRNGPNAARYADMARLFFWQYRLRDRRLPEDWEFNFGIADTQRALDSNENAVRVLEKIRDHLVSVSKLILVTPEGEQARTDRRSARVARRTMRGELLFIHEENTKRASKLEALLQGFERKLDTNAAMFDQIKQAFQHILEQQRIADKQHVELRDAFRRIENLFVRDVFNEGDALKQFDHTPCLDSTLTYRRNDDGTLERLDYTPSLDSTPVLDEIEQENNNSKQPL